MKKQSPFLFGWWLGPALAFDFEDLNNPVSPAFNLELATGYDSGFELQREPEPSFDISEQTPANSSLFVSDLLGDIDLWDDDGGESLLERQTRTCPPGTRSLSPISNNVYLGFS